MYRRFVDEPPAVALACPPVFPRDGLPARFIFLEWQSAYRAPVKRGEGKFPDLVDRAEVRAHLVSRHGRDNRIASRVVREMVQVTRPGDLLWPHLPPSSPVARRATASTFPRSSRETSPVVRTRIASSRFISGSDTFTPVPSLISPASWR